MLQNNLKNMYINNIFEKFLENEVNLDPTRYARTLKATGVLSGYISNHEDFKNLYVKTTTQGSSRQKTIIKPVDVMAAFDLDLLVELKENSGWKPKDYITKLSQAFRDSGRYKDLTDTDGKTRCVTIDYEGDFHVDLVPTIKIDGEYYIFNKLRNEIEKTDGDGYAQWFSRQNELANGHLVSVVRLLKHLRDKDKSFDTKSIILTTIAGMQIGMSNSYNSLPEAFAMILSSMSYFLANFDNPPSINNPAMPGETFNRHWKNDQAGFKRFRNAIREYSEAANKAYILKDNDALKEWRNIFGDKFGSSPTIIKDREVLIPSFPAGFSLGDFSHKQSLSNAGLVDRGNNSLPITITAGLYWGTPAHKTVNRRLIKNFSSGSILPPNHWLKYTANGSFEPHHRLYWQVVNTGAHARSLGGLRGEIFNDAAERWERSLYTGIHWIECYVVDSRTQECAGRSKPFYVVFNNTDFPFRI